MRLRAALIALAAIAAVPAATQGAARRRPPAPASVPGLYRVVFSGEGGYAHTYTSQQGAITATADLHWRTVYPSVRVESTRRAGAAAGGGAADRRSSTFGGTWSVSIDGDAQCSASGTLGDTRPGPLAVRSLSAARGRFVLDLAAVSGIAGLPAGAPDCSMSPVPDFWADWPTSDGVAGQAHVLGASVTLAPARSATHTFHVGPSAGETPPSDCGTQAVAHVSCSVDYDWHGTVTVTRLRGHR